MGKAEIIEILRAYKKEFAKKGNNKSKFLILLFILGGLFFYRRKMKSLKR